MTSETFDVIVAGFGFAGAAAAIAAAASRGARRLVMDSIRPYDLSGNVREEPVHEAL